MVWDKVRCTWPLLIGALIIQLYTTLQADSTIKILDIKKKIALVRKECIDLYRAFFATTPIKKNAKLFPLNKKISLFPENIEDLINVNRNFYRKGTPLLQLIDALECKKYLDREEQGKNEQLIPLANATLEKINELFCLKFLCMICSFDCSKSIDKSLLKGYHSLFNAKVEDENGILFPFHTLLSEIAITILMIKFNNLTYYAKKESLVYSLALIHEKLLHANKTLGLQRINCIEITDFIDSLGQYALKKPIVSSDRVNFFAKAAIAVIIIGGITFYALDQKFPDWVKRKSKEMFGGIMNFLGPNYLGENTIKAVKEDLGKDLAKVMTATQRLETITLGIQESLGSTQKTIAHVITTLDNPQSNAAKTIDHIATSIDNITATIAPLTKTIDRISDGISTAYTKTNWKAVGITCATIAAATTLKIIGGMVGVL